MRVSPAGKKLVVSISVAIVGYLASYLYLRSTSIERWEKDGRDYVIFPQQPVIVYYFYRPLSLVDAALTGEWRLLKQKGRFFRAAEAAAHVATVSVQELVSWFV